MTRNILLPTDFSIESLRLLKESLRLTETGTVNIIMFHCLHLSDSIVDLLFQSRKNIIESLLTPDFEDGCKILKNKYNDRINSIGIELFFGGTQNAFTNFLDANNIDEVYILKPFAFTKPHSRSFSPERLIRKSKVSITEVAWTAPKNVPEKNKLAEIFLL